MNPTQIQTTLKELRLSGLSQPLPVRLQELLGYNIHPPFVGNVDGRHPRKTLE